MVQVAGMYLHEWQGHTHHAQPNPWWICNGPVKHLAIGLMSYGFNLKRIYSFYLISTILALITILAIIVNSFTMFLYEMLILFNHFKEFTISYSTNTIEGGIMILHCPSVGTSVDRRNGVHSLQ